MSVEQPNELDEDRFRFESNPEPTVSVNNYDDLPIGQSNKNNFSEYPSENDPPKPVRKVNNTKKIGKPPKK
jgi:hypothetical protein